MARWASSADRVFSAARESWLAARARPGRATGLAWVALCVAVISALAGCSGSAAPSGSSAPTATASAAATSPGTASASASGTASAVSAAAFVPIVEPFDPGHPAKTKPAPGSCGGQSSTLAIEQCYEARTENTDVMIDAAQLAHFQSGPQAQRAAILADDSAWLASRQPVCAKAFHSGGSIDGINTASCLLDESTARLDGLKGITPRSRSCSPPTTPTSARCPGTRRRRVRGSA